MKMLPLITSITAIFLYVTLTAVASPAGESSTNGIYGGYVGSDRWFSTMRQSAANQAMLESLAGTNNHKQVPAKYVEFSGQIIFPEGNPFPGKRLPDLRIVARDQNADPVKRAPYIDKNDGFYTVLKKGQTYDFYWMYYFGSKEKFASVHVDSDGPRMLKLAIEYKPQKSAGAPAALRSTTHQPPEGGKDYQAPQAGEGYKPPKVGPGYQAPGIRQW